MSDLIKDLQKKPYRERVKILRIVLVIVAILITVIWTLTIRFRNQPQGEPFKFKEIWQNIRNLPIW